jgi:hypothetical protein
MPAARITLGDFRENGRSVSRFTVIVAPIRHGARDGWMTGRPDPRETPMFAKTLILALALAGVSLGFIGSVSAAPARGDVWQPSQNYMQDRHDPTNTNGF